MPPRSEASGPDLAGGKFVAGHGHPEHPGGVAGQDAQRRRRRRQHRSPADDKTMPDVAGEIQGRKAAMPPGVSCELARQLGNAAGRHIGGSGIEPGTGCSGQGAGCGRLRAGQRMRSLAKTWSLDFSLIRPPPGTCLQLAREIGGNRDSCSMTKDAWPKVVRGQSLRRVISGC